MSLTSAPIKRQFAGGLDRLGLAAETPYDKRSVFLSQFCWTGHPRHVEHDVRGAAMVLLDDAQILLRTLIPTEYPELGESGAAHWWVDPTAATPQALPTTVWTSNWPRILAVSTHEWGLEPSEPSPTMLVQDALRRSDWILELPENWDDQGASPYERTVWEETEKVLLALAHNTRRRAARNMPVPAIDPGDKGSVDLFWQLDDRRLLANLPADPNKPITFFGKDQSGFAISGEIHRGEEADPKRYAKAVSMLAAWLVTSG